MKNIIYGILLAFCPFALVGQTASPYAKQIQEFDKYVQTARNNWNVPGLAIAIVKNHQVIFKKGYGVRQLGKPESIDIQTLFACASTTKAMTATCMGMLVDEGKLDWNDAVIKYLPDFQLYDPYVTRELRIRDLFIHDSGLGNTDFLWTGMNISSDEIVRRIKLVIPSYSLRAGFIYQNIFYLVAGKVIEKVSGQPWEQFIKQRIFDPLAMTRTQPTLRAVNDPNQAKPHMVVNGLTMVIENTSADAIGPAGSVWSCVDDMSKWSLCMLDSSKYAGGRLLKPSTWTEMFKPQTIAPNEFYPTQQILKSNWATYALGWFQQDYKGKKLNFHTGSLAGMVALHAQMPEEGISLYVFANSDHAELRHALVYKMIDLFALGGTRDWSAEFQKLYQKVQVIVEKPQKDFEANRVLNSAPSLDLSEYAGRYADPLYGEVEVTVREKNLSFDINHFTKATLGHWHYDTFYGNYEKAWHGKAKAVFNLNANGKVERLNFDGMGFTKLIR